MSWTPQTVIHTRPDPATGHWPEPIDLSELLTREPSPPRMIIDDWMPCGYATLLAGHGGAGKSNIALYLAACIATGREFFSVSASKRRVLYLSCEDRTDVLHWRLNRICAHADIDVAALADGLAILDLVGHDAILYQRDPMAGSTTTLAYEALRQRVETSGTEVVIVDGVADTYGGREADRGEIKQYINALVALVGTGGAVLLVHHINRATATQGQTTEGYSGSTGWNNSVRARWYLYPEVERGDEGTERTGDLVLELQKSNLGRTDQAMKFRWDDDAHLFVGEIVGGMSHFDRVQRDRDEQDGILAALRAVVADGDGYCPAAAQGPRTAHHVLSARPELPDSLRGRANRRRFWGHIEHLRQIRHIVTGTYRRTNRHLVETLEAVEPVNTDTCASAPYTHTEYMAHCDAGAQCADASHSHGGYGGRARAHGGDDNAPDTPCPACDGEGCVHCGDAGRTVEAI